MRTVLRMQGSVAELGAAVMQQADVAALWLLEALILTLPQSLLQAYVVVSTDVGIMSPGSLTQALHDFCDTCVTCSRQSMTFFFSFFHQWPIAVVCVCFLFPGHWFCTAEPAV